MRHRALVVAVVAGLICLPTTYTLTREGDVILSVLVVVGIGAASAVVALAVVPAGVKQQLMFRLLQCWASF